MAYEEFQSYGGMVGKSTIVSITWNGRYIQSTTDKKAEVIPIFRKDVKKNICGSAKTKDKDVRASLIERFGIVGTKYQQGFFYGFKSDIWSAYAVAVTYIDFKKKGQL